MTLTAFFIAMLLATASCAQAQDSGVAIVAQAKMLMRSGDAGAMQARTLFETAAQQGSGPAAYYLGLMLKNGMGGAQDSAAALRWLERAAQRQVAPAMFITANLLQDSDAEQARYWLDNACAVEYPEALMQKSIALNEGAMGYEPDQKQAALYLKMAEHAMGNRQPDP